MNPLEIYKLDSKIYPYICYFLTLVLEWKRVAYFPLTAYVLQFPHFFLQSFFSINYPTYSNMCYWNILHFQLVPWLKASNSCSGSLIWDNNCKFLSKYPKTIAKKNGNNSGSCVKLHNFYTAYYFLEYALNKEQT